MIRRILKLQNVGLLQDATQDVAIALAKVFGIMRRAYPGDQPVEHFAIGFLAELSWSTVSVLEEAVAALSTPNLQIT